MNGENLKIFALFKINLVLAQQSKPCSLIHNSSNMTTSFQTVLPSATIDPIVLQWISDDMPSFDVGGMVVGDKIGSASLLMKTSGVFAGKPFVDSVFRQLDCEVEWLAGDKSEGNYFDLKPDEKILMATVTGRLNKILQGERTALNTLSRVSGVATASHEVVSIKKKACWNGFVAGTRKTTPGFRIAEKYGLLVGGCATHRLDLSQMVMLKDNHIWANGSITDAVKIAKNAAGFSAKIEVECQSLEEAQEAATAGADIVMLDNFGPDRIKIDAPKLKKKFPHLLVEASGGITRDTLERYMLKEVDIISSGKLTQGYDCVDFSLKINR